VTLFKLVFDSPEKKLYRDKSQEFTYYNYNILNSTRYTILEYYSICISISKNRQNNFKILSY